MNTTIKWKVGMLMIAMTLVGGTLQAQPWHRRWHYRSRPVVTVVTRPAVTTHVSNRFSQKERFEMAMAYLNSHKHLTVKQYAKMTKLGRASAEAELDAFAQDKRKPLQLRIIGKKKVYVKAGNTLTSQAATIGLLSTPGCVSAS